MKREYKGGKETWDDFEKRVGMKRTGSDAKKTGTKAPNDILVQWMSPTASGRLKKFEPLDTRDFIPFDEYEELTLDNIKEACEKFYKAPEDSCDILASDRGPSCIKLEKLKGKKVFFIRFIPPCDVGTKDKMLPCHLQDPVRRFQSTCHTRHPNQPSHLSPCRLVNYLKLGNLLNQRNKIWPP